MDAMLAELKAKAAAKEAAAASGAPAPAPKPSLPPPPSGKAAPNPLMGGGGGGMEAMLAEMKAKAAAKEAAAASAPAPAPKPAPKPAAAAPAGGMEAMLAEMKAKAAAKEAAAATAAAAAPPPVKAAAPTPVAAAPKTPEQEFVEDCFKMACWTAAGGNGGSSVATKQQLDKFADAIPVHILSGDAVQQARADAGAAGAGGGGLPAFEAFCQKLTDAAGRPLRDIVRVFRSRCQAAMAEAEEAAEKAAKAAAKAKEAAPTPAPVAAVPAPAAAPKPAPTALRSSEPVPSEGVVYHHQQQLQQQQVQQPELATTAPPQHRSPAAGRDIGPVFSDISALRQSYAMADEGAASMDASARAGGASVLRGSGGGFVVASPPLEGGVGMRPAPAAGHTQQQLQMGNVAIGELEHYQQQQHQYSPPQQQYQQGGFFHVAHSPQMLQQHVQQQQQQQMGVYNATPPRGPLRHLSGRGDSATVGAGSPSSAMHFAAGASHPNYPVPSQLQPHQQQRQHQDAASSLVAPDGIPLALHAAFSAQDIEKLRALLMQGGGGGGADPGSPSSPKAEEARRKIVALLGELQKIEDQHGAHSARPTFDATPAQLTHTELAVEIARASDAFFGWLRRATMYAQGELSRHCEDAYAATAGAISASCQPSSDIVLDANQRSAMRQILTSWRLMWVRARGEDETALEERVRELQSRWYAVQRSELAEQAHLGNVFLDQLRLLVSEAAALMPAPARDAAVAAMNCPLSEHRRAVLMRMEQEAAPRLRLDPAAAAATSPGASWLRVHGGQSPQSPFSPVRGGAGVGAAGLNADPMGGHHLYSASLNEALAFRRGLERALTSSSTTTLSGSPPLGGMSPSQRAASRPWR